MALDIHQLHARFSEIEVERKQWEGMWRQLSEYFMPPSHSFNDQGINNSSGRLHNTKSFEDTPAWAANTLASALLGMIANPVNKWLEFGLISNTENADDTVQTYLQGVKDSVLHILQLPQVGFYSKMHEALLEYVIFGQTVILVTKDPNTGLPRFRPCPLQECFFILDEDGTPEIVFRRTEMSARLVVDLYPDAVSAEFKEKARKNPTTKHKVIHAVFPRNTHGFKQFAKNKAFASVYYLEDTELTLLKESGFDKFPYLIPFWQRFSGESQARGPGVFALPSVRMLNQIVKDSLKASQKIIDPPLILNRRGWLGKVKNYPASISFSDGMDMDQLWRPFGNTGEPVLGLEWAIKYTDQIKRIFHIDKIHSPQKAAEQREVEVLQNEEERMRDMVPQLANLHMMMSHMIELVVDIIKDKLPEPPPQLDGEVLRLNYMSPMARAQKMMEMASVNRTLSQFVFPLASLDESVLQKIHTGRLVDWIFDSGDIPTNITRTNEEVEAAQAQQQQNEAMLQGVEMAKGMAEVAKDLGSAPGAV